MHRFSKNTLAGALIFLLLPFGFLAQDFYGLLAYKNKIPVELPEYIHFYNSSAKALSPEHFFYLSYSCDSLIVRSLQSGEEKFYPLEKGLQKKLFYKDNTLTVENSLKIGHFSLTHYRVLPDTLLPDGKGSSKYRLGTYARYENLSKHFTSDYEKNILRINGRLIEFPEIKYHYLNHLQPTRFFDFNDSVNIIVDPFSYVFFFSSNDGSLISDSSYMISSDRTLADKILKNYSRKNPKKSFDDLDTLLFQNVLIWEINILDRNLLLVKKSVPFNKRYKFYYDVFRFHQGRLTRVLADLSYNSPPDENAVIGRDCPEFVSLNATFQGSVVSGNKLLILKQDIPGPYSGKSYSEYTRIRDEYFMNQSPVNNLFIYEFRIP